MNIEVRNKILSFEEELRKLPQTDIPPVHYFADGIYAREITIPKGTVLTGKIHKTEHLNIISKGEISVVTEEGNKRIVSPCTFVAKPGTKRVGYAHEDTVWTTIHASKEKDLEKLELELISPDYMQLEEVELLA